MEVGQGRMLIEILPVQNEMNGMTIPVGERNPWGLVVKVGEPSIHQYTEAQMRQWETIGKHPCAIQPGDKVLLAGVRGIQVVIEGKTYHIVLQDEIPAWESSRTEKGKTGFKTYVGKPTTNLSGVF